MNTRLGSAVQDQADYLSKRNDVTLFATYAKESWCYPDLMRGLDMWELVGITISKRQDIDKNMVTFCPPTHVLSGGFNSNLSRNLIDCVCPFISVFIDACISTEFLHFR
jgi:hypothetical protein